MVYPDYSIEVQSINRGDSVVVGVDEVGRGAGAGVVTAAAVHVPVDMVPYLLGKVNDSKKLSQKRREELFDVIVNNTYYAIQDVDVEVIDKINIFEATKLAMSSALSLLNESIQISHALVDGPVNISGLTDTSYTNIIRGDSKSLSIAAASILAKVHRDRLMIKLHTTYPLYNWEKNKGYLTKEHIEAINTYGITQHHRTSFRKVGR